MGDEDEGEAEYEVGDGCECDCCMAGGFVGDKFGSEGLCSRFGAESDGTSSRIPCETAPLPEEGSKWDSERDLDLSPLNCGASAADASRSDVGGRGSIWCPETSITTAG